MICVAYQKTMAGAALRAAQRGIKLGEAIPSPKPLPKPVEAAEPAQRVVVPFVPRPMVAWPKPDKPAYLAVETVPLSSPKQVIAAVMAWHPCITVEDIMGPSRRRPVIAAKFDAMAAVHENCRIDGRLYSLTELGRVFGRDHTSILSALRRRGYQEKR